MNGSRQKARHAENRTERGSDDSRAHGVVRERVPLAQLSGLEDDQTEGTGEKRDLAAGVGQDVVNFLVRPVPVVESLGHRSGDVPPDPEQYDNPEQPSFHRTFIPQSEFAGQI